MQADGNSEYLYSRFTDKHPEVTNAYLVLTPQAPGWVRLSACEVKLVPTFTREFNELFLRSGFVVSSQIFNLRYDGKTLTSSRFVGFQHGVQLNDMTNWVNSKYFDIFVATGAVETEYLRKFAPIEVINSGLPGSKLLKALPRRAVPFSSSSCRPGDSIFITSVPSSSAIPSISGRSTPCSLTRAAVIPRTH